MNLIQTYFKRQLEQRGYPTDDICYSLNSCQGDGLAFYGSIEEEALIGFVDALMTGTEKAAVKRAINKGATVTIERNSFATHYSHFNTMTVEGESYYADALTEFEETAFDAFIEALAEDVVTTSKELESDGYAIIDAGSSYGALDGKVREFNTARFTLRIEELEDENFSMEYWDESLIDDTLQGFIDAKQRYFCLKVSIMEQEDGIVLGDIYLGGCVESNDASSRTYGGYLRQMVAESIKEARDFIESVSLAA